MSARIGIVALVGMSLLAACAPEGDVDQVESLQGTPYRQSDIEPPAADEGLSVPTVLNGQPTRNRPEIGGVWIGNSGFCTGTLIRRNIVITAAHCVDFRSRTQPGDYGRFEITQANGQTQSFTYDLVYSYTETASERDIALLHLKQDVPASVATPTQIATREARPGEQAAIYGYGCTNRNGGGGGQPTKRKYDFSYSTTHNLCSGDSGGPVVIGADGPVFHINSGYIIGSGEDLFGDAHIYRDDLIRQIVAWNGSDDPIDNDPEPEPEPLPATVVNITNATGSKIWVHCNGQPSDTCSGWTLLRPGQSGLLKTPDRSLFLYNVGFGADVTFEMRKVTVPGEDATLYLNQDNPLQSPQGDDQPNPEPVQSVNVTNNTGTSLYVHCGGQESAVCSGWRRIEQGARAKIDTPNPSIYLYNVNFNPNVVFNLRRVSFQSDDITIYPNDEDPLRAPEVRPGPGPDIHQNPVPQGSVQVTNATGSRLYVHCDGPPSATCSDWVLLENGEASMVKTDNGGLLLHNSDFNPAVVFYVRQVQATGERVSIYANESNPFAPR